MMDPEKHLPDELRALSKESVGLLGKVIERELGRAGFRSIENIRKEMADLRDVSPELAHRKLKRMHARFKKMSAGERFAITHSFALMLEILNACENAYRTYRLKSRRTGGLNQKPDAIIYVLTAHPTEARSPANVGVFHEIQLALTDVLLEGGEHAFSRQQDRIRNLIEVAWRLLTARGRKPSVRDEAQHLYSILLRRETLNALLKANRELAPVYVRSWVGGDKDGHPGVDEKTMVLSLSLSRAELVRFVREKISEVRVTLKWIEKTSPELLRAMVQVEKTLSSLTKLKSADGARVRRYREKFRVLSEVYLKNMGVLHPSLVDAAQVNEVFPALVVPLELREASDILLEAQAGNPTAIERMVFKLAALSKGANPKWYVRGLIVSMASKLEHMLAAANLVCKGLGECRIPVIPLFEQRDALEHATEIVSAMLKDRRIRQAVDKYWNGYFEVMLGYSDSSKEIGVLASRVEIAQAVEKLDALFLKKKVTPVYFHGSGGSIDRGGGPIEEQTAWWPESALKIYKATLQGEMIERSFASPEITRSRLEQIARRYSERAPNKSKKTASAGKAVQEFAACVAEAYQSKVASAGFLEVVQKATAYPYLSVLRLGSRPSKRVSGFEFSVASLRAIPWILCWTQTRVLFPTWWGVGQCWKKTTTTQKLALRRAFVKEPLFRSYVKLLGFTLAKVELPIWLIYLEESGLSADRVRQVFKEFEDEYLAAIKFVRSVSGKENLLWFRPWLGSSIRLRSSMIHPLNLLQIIALKNRDLTVIRETVTGISIGMVTTG
jgi:phosphoenolpyruvate carboxylase